MFAKKEDAPEEEGVERCRRYDISITYDAYYKTPRLWLLGYDESKEVLSTEMFDDVMAEHAKTTVTIEPHHNMSGVP